MSNRKVRSPDSGVGTRDPLSLQWCNFYRATLMHSADYAVTRCLSVRLSVCHTPVLCLNGYTIHISSKFYSPSCSPTILVFKRPTLL